MADSVASASDHYQGRLNVALLTKLFRVLSVLNQASQPPSAAVQQRMCTYLGQ